MLLSLKVAGIGTLLFLPLGVGISWALARALATSPEVLLLDEPLASLDLPLRGRVLRYLKTLRRELDIPMVYVSHALSEVLALADHVLVLDRGRELAFDQSYRVLSHPGVAPLVPTGSLENLLEARVLGHHEGGRLTQVAADGVTLWVKRLQREPGQSVSISIGASDILIALGESARLSARNVLPAAILSADVVGPEMVVTADAGPRLLVEMSRESAAALDLAPGREVFLAIKASSIAVLE